MATPTKRHSLPPRQLHLATSNLDSFSRTSSSSDVASPSLTTPLPPKRPATKRQQSISYLPHDSDPRWSIRAPTAAASPLSISSEGMNSPVSLAPQRENTPLTLAEKCVYHYPHPPIAAHEPHHKTLRLAEVHRSEGSQMHGTPDTTRLAGG